MKRIMMAFVAVAVASVAQAASINWSATGVANSPSYTSGTPTYMAYFIEGTATDLANYKAGLANAETAAATVAAIIADATYTKANTYVAASGVNNFMSNGNATTHAAGENVSAFAIIFDSATGNPENYMATSVLTKEISGNAATAFGFGVQTSNSWSAVAVPEPTSGLLLLLGVAGLALKRRRA